MSLGSTATTPLRWAARRAFRQERPTASDDVSASRSSRYPNSRYVVVPWKWPSLQPLRPCRVSACRPSPVMPRLPLDAMCHERSSRTVGVDLRVLRLGGHELRQRRLLLPTPQTERSASRAQREPRCLDLGCGSGWPVARHLADSGFHVTGVNTSPTMISLCRNRLPDMDGSLPTCERCRLVVVSRASPDRHRPDCCGLVANSRAGPSSHRRRPRLCSSSRKY